MNIKHKKENSNYEYDNLSISCLMYLLNKDLDELEKIELKEKLQELD